MMEQLVADGTVEPRAAYDHALRKEPFEPYLTDESAPS